MKSIIAAALLLTGSAFTFIAAQSWTIAEDYNIAFSSDDAKEGPAAFAQKRTPNWTNR